MADQGAKAPFQPVIPAPDASRSYDYDNEVAFRRAVEAYLSDSKDSISQNTQDATEGGGGLSVPGALYVLNNHWIRTNGWSAEPSSATFGFAVGVWRSYPFVLHRPATVTDIAIIVSTARPDSTVNVGIYSAGADGLPSTLLANENYNTATTGLKSNTLGTPLSLSAGTVYWVAFTRAGGTGTTIIRACSDVNFVVTLGQPAAHETNDIRNYAGANSSMVDPAPAITFWGTAASPTAWLKT